MVCVAAFYFLVVFGPLTGIQVGPFNERGDCRAVRQQVGFQNTTKCWPAHEELLRPSNED